MTLIKIAMQAKTIVTHLTLCTFNIYIYFGPYFLLMNTRTLPFNMRIMFLKIISKKIKTQRPQVAHVFGHNEQFTNYEKVAISLNENLIT